MAETRQEWQDRIRSVGYLGGGRTRSRSKTGTHPETGDPCKTTRDELGNDVRESGPRGSGVSARQDVEIHAKTIEWDMREHQ